MTTTPHNTGLPAFLPVTAGKTGLLTSLRVASPYHCAGLAGCFGAVSPACARKMEYVPPTAQEVQ
jgi:hypothetical protein